MSIPTGKALLAPFNRIRAVQLPIKVVYFHWNRALYEAIADCRSLLNESTSALTRCRELVAAWPD